MSVSIPIRGEKSLSRVQIEWGKDIPLRDGVTLSATLYLPASAAHPAPCIVTMTPYIAQTYHDQGMYFAERGFPFVCVDVRGRGNSGGEFDPFAQELPDGHDVVVWLAKQPFCDGRVATWGGSYAGLNQWNTARARPEALKTIVPVASPYMGVDFPMRRNIAFPYLLQWLTLVWGHTSQDKLFWSNERFWGERFRTWFDAGCSFAELDVFLGCSSNIFQQWISHPKRDDFWDCQNPSSDEYASIDIPILTITGIYDDDQSGALQHYKQHVESHGGIERANHYLVIGPWDHAGTRSPQRDFSGLHFGEASLVDLQRLHLDWYNWVFRGHSKPSFLQAPVTYYVVGADCWRYAGSLDRVTKQETSFYLHAVSNPIDVFGSGVLRNVRPTQARVDTYVHDPRTCDWSALEATVDPEDRTDQRMVLARSGHQLVYHSERFIEDIEIAGFFRFNAWISLDQPDADLRVTIYEVDGSGRSKQLGYDQIRARYRSCAKSEVLVDTKEPLLYTFDEFTFIAAVIPTGSRLRLVLDSNHSIYTQRNWNSGGPVSWESCRDARVVTIALHDSPDRPCELFIPLGRAESSYV